MSNNHDDLAIFDDLEPEHEISQNFRRINETVATGKRPGGKRALIALVLVLVIALGTWRFTQWNNARQTKAETPPAPVATTETGAATPSTSASYLNGDKPQAVEGREEANPSAVSIPAATMPEIDAKDAESVMRGFITITNSRDSTDDFNRVKEWVVPYSAIEDMSGFDAYGNDTADILPAPVTVEKIEVKDPTNNQPRNTSMRQSRVLETTVLASTGQKLRLEWEVTAMLAETGQWKVTEANLYSWQGISQ